MKTNFQNSLFLICYKLLIQELPFNVVTSGSANKSPPTATPLFPTTPLAHGISKSMETLSQSSLDDSGLSSSATSPVIIGLNNDIVHLVEIVDGMRTAVDDILVRVKTLEANQAWLSPLVSRIAEGIGALGRIVAARAQEQTQIGQAIICAEHELGAITKRNYFALPVTSRKQHHCSFCGMAGNISNLFLKHSLKPSSYPALPLIIYPL